MNDNDLKPSKTGLISDNGKNIVPPFDTRRADPWIWKHQHLYLHCRTWQFHKKPPSFWATHSLRSHFRSGSWRRSLAPSFWAGSNRTVTLTDRGKGNPALRPSHEAACRWDAGDGCSQSRKCVDICGSPCRIRCARRFAEKLFVLCSGSTRRLRWKSWSPARMRCSDFWIRIRWILYTLDRHIYHSDYAWSSQRARKQCILWQDIRNSLNGKKQILLQELICQPFILTEKKWSYRRMLSEYLASRSLEIQPVLRWEIQNWSAGCWKKNASAISLLPDYMWQKRPYRKKTGAAGCERFSTCNMETALISQR